MLVQHCLRQENQQIKAGVCLHVCAGTLPEGWDAGFPGNLSTIMLSNNSLSGTLPKSWSNLVSLAYLDLSVNQLEGELPAEWGSLKGLTSL